MGTDKQNAFTLIELLVVVAIISVLAALLMPALTSALDSARQAQCGSHLKQVHLGLVMYVEDFGGTPPTQGNGDGWVTKNSRWVYWHWNDFLVRFDYVEIPGAPMTHTQDYTIQIGRKLPGVFLCPAETYDDSVSNSGKLSLGYGATRIWEWRHLVPKYPEQGRSHTLTEFHPSKFIFGDGRVLKLESWLSGSTVYDDFKYRHRGKANTIAVDGHVASYGYPIVFSAPENSQ